MVSKIPEKCWCCNNNDWDNLPTEGVENGQRVINMETGETKMFDDEKQKWNVI